MILINPIPGQEVRNSDFLLEEGAAVRCNYPTTVGYKIDSLLDDPGRVQRMAASARRLGRMDAAQQIVTAVLAEPNVLLWISRAAQAAIRTAAEEGLSARYADRDADRRVVTLVDTETEISAGVATLAQLKTLTPILTGEDTRLDMALTVTPALLALLKKPGGDRDLYGLLKHILGKSEEITLRLEE
jgi:processive 1,2-diacylglycerol beta-glucosyltransferase